MEHIEELDDDFVLDDDIKFTIKMLYHCKASLIELAEKTFDEYVREDTEQMNEFLKLYDIQK